MNFLALVGALALTYYRPHIQPDWLKQVLAPYAAWLERNCNDGNRKHGIIAWCLGALLPSLLVAVIYYCLLRINFLLAILFGIVVLYFTLRFSQFGRRSEEIAAALRDKNIDGARALLSGWQPTIDAHHYSLADIARVSIETLLKRTHHGLFAPIFWFVLLGPAGAVLYRLTHLLKMQWQDLMPEVTMTSSQPLAAEFGGQARNSQQTAFCHFTRVVFDWLNWLPTRVTAACFAIVGDFEDAIYCWRAQAETWPDRAVGILLASGAGALGVRLGEPLPDRGIVEFRPELGLGDEAEADYLHSAVGMAWRVLALLTGLLLLLTFANWLGN